MWHGVIGRTFPLDRLGGYFERTTSEKRDSEDLRKVKGGLDIYGRTRTGDGSPKVSPTASPKLAEGGPRNSLVRSSALWTDKLALATEPKLVQDAVGTLPSKTDRQKAALERLRAPKKKRHLAQQVLRGFAKSKLIGIVLLSGWECVDRTRRCSGNELSPPRTRHYRAAWL